MNVESILKEKVIEALRYSYAPYSKIHVSAAILCNDDSIYTGVNIENASYSVTICAERVALFKAVSEGHREFKAIMITSDIGLLTPCGVCRQALYEFSQDMEVITIYKDQQKKWKINELLPVGFSLGDK